MWIANPSRTWRRPVLLAWLAFVAGPLHACDRACLRGVLDHYLEAVFHHAPADAALAPGHRATENAQPLVAGESVWRSVGGYGSVGRRYVDTRAQQAAYFGLLAEDAGPALASVRLKVRAHQVLEAEWTVARAAYGGMFSVQGLEQDPPPAEQLLPATQRTPRAQMLRAANAYFEALQRHDGSNVPHVAGCERVENGVRVTHSRRPAPVVADGAPPEELSGDCVAGFEAFAHSIASTDLRRFPLVDEQAGVVMGTTLFHRPPGASLRRNLLTEYFHIRQGRIAAIYAAMYYLPPEAEDSSGWPATASR
ncbi:MAG: hypothetical protein RL684_3091 [Pseudomonadota bacterium]|jgi:hypothetical protein